MGYSFPNYQMEIDKILLRKTDFIPKLKNILRQYRSTCLCPSLSTLVIQDFFYCEDVLSDKLRSINCISLYHLSSHFLSHFLRHIAPIAHWLFVPQIQRAIPTHKAKRRFTPTTSTVPLAPKNSTTKAIDT